MRIIFLALCCFATVVRSLSISKCTGNERDLFLDTTHGRAAGSCKFVTINDNNQKYFRSSNVYSWLGIPYAEPPIFDNRFKRTVEAKPWTEILNATRLPSACLSEMSNDIQEKANQSKSLEQFSGFTMWRTSSRQPISFSEDCLYLNIYVPAEVYLKVNLDPYAPTPAKPPKPPIMVFFHGGQTQFGSSSLDVYDPSTLVAASNVIVVTVNYRLGIFGFLSYGDEIGGNQALYDQHEALKWIKNNAESIGGDPERITLMGHEAGAALGGYHLFYRDSWPYFTNIILQSGSPLLTALQPISKREANHRATEIIKYIGCSSDSNDEVLTCLRSANHLAESAHVYFSDLLKAKKHASLYLQTYFPPVVDGDIVRDNPQELLKRGDFKKCPILLGFTADEGSSTIALSGLMGSRAADLRKQQNISHDALTSFVNEYFSFYPNYPRETSELFISSIMHEYTRITSLKQSTLAASSSHLLKSNYFHTLNKIIADEAYICPAYRLAEHYSKAGLNVFLYLYAHRISSTPWPSWYGAVHGDDLAMTFAQPLAMKQPRVATSTNPWSNAKHNYPSSEKLLSNELITYWTNFAKLNTPNKPNSISRTWPEFKLTKRPVPKNSTGHMSELWGQYLILKTNGTKIGKGYSIDQCQFWSSHLPKFISNQGLSPSFFIALKFIIIAF